MDRVVGVRMKGQDIVIDLKYKSTVAGREKEG